MRIEIPAAPALDIIIGTAERPVGDETSGDEIADLDPAGSQDHRRRSRKSRLLYGIGSVPSSPAPLWAMPAAATERTSRSGPSGAFLASNQALFIKVSDIPGPNSAWSHQAVEERILYRCHQQEITPRPVTTTRRPGHPVVEHQDLGRDEILSATRLTVLTSSELQIQQLTDVKGLFESHHELNEIK